MATGSSSYSDISTLVDNIHSGAIFTLRQQNVLVRTVTVLRATGMAPRDVNQYGTANVRAVGELDDVLPTQFTPSNLATLTPAEYADQFLLTDARVATDYQNVRADAALELGAAFAQDVDENIATLFASSTGGTVGSLGSALTWTNILGARSLMQANKVPGPYYCALHPHQWLDLVLASAVSGAGFANAPGFQDALVSTYFVSPMIGGVTFVVTPSIAVITGDDAYGAMYSPMAFAYDERSPFVIEPERDASRRAWELNARISYAYGVWDATRAVAIRSDATAPS
jgi:hypothetical protein